MKNIKLNNKSINLEQNERGILIDTIIEFAGDEYETRNDYIQLAKQSENELLKEVQSILEYYKENYSGNDKDIEDMENIIGNIVFS